MKKILATAAALTASLSPALASSHYEMMYHDNIRPHGHPRSDAVYNAALDDCYSQTGLARTAQDNQAFRDCMVKHDYRRVYTKLVQDPPSKRAASRLANTPAVNARIPNSCSRNIGCATRVSTIPNAISRATPPGP